MAVDYSNLWKLLIDKHMNKSQLREAAKISTNAIAKLGRNVKRRRTSSTKRIIYCFDIRL